MKRDIGKGGIVIFGWKGHRGCRSYVCCLSALDLVCKSFGSMTIFLQNSFVVYVLACCLLHLGNFVLFFCLSIYLLSGKSVKPWARDFSLRRAMCMQRSSCSPHQGYIPYLPLFTSNNHFSLLRYLLSKSFNLNLNLKLRNHSTTPHLVFLSLSNCLDWRRRISSNDTALLQL